MGRAYRQLGDGRVRTQSPPGGGFRFQGLGYFVFR